MLRSATASGLLWEFAMPEALTEHKRMARFGLFRADFRTGEIWRNGERIHLQDQPFRMLELLLEAHGELVTREELKHRLWPDQTYVTEAALNTCATRLRVALGDEADDPRFIQTVARRGYRFVAPVELGNGTGEEPEVTAPAHNGAETAVPDPIPSDPPAARPRASTAAVVAVALAAAAFSLGIVGLVLLWYHVAGSR